MPSPKPQWLQEVSLNAAPKCRQPLETFQVPEIVRFEWLKQGAGPVATILTQTL